MILELVLYMLAAAMTGCTVHIAFLDVGVLSLGMAFPTVGDRLLFGISAFPALSGIYLGIYYFNGFCRYISGDAPASLTAFLASVLLLVLIAPSGDGYMTEHGFGRIGRNFSFHSFGGIPRIVDRQFGFLIPSE